MRRLYPYNVETGNLNLVPGRSIRVQKRAADGSFVISNVGKVPVKFGKSRLMMTSEACSAAEAAALQHDCLTPFNSDNFSESGDDRNGAHEEQKWDIYDSRIMLSVACRLSNGKIAL